VGGEIGQTDRGRADFDGAELEKNIEPVKAKTPVKKEK